MKLWREITNWINQQKNSQTDLKGEDWNRWWMPVVGLLALIWFLIRVIPKPSRLRYPCQRAAAPIAMGFLGWLGATFGLTISIRKFIGFIKKSRYWAAGGILVICLAVAGSYLALNTETPVTARQQGPLGQGQGLNPGRVVWNHNPEATSWDGDSNYWWDDSNIDREVVAEMWGQSLKELAGKETPEQAWQALFTHFNRKQRGGDRGYTKGEQVTIKLNLNTHKSYNDRDNEVDTAPQMVEVLVASLVEAGGVKPRDIVLYDASRPLADKIYDRVYERYPEVTFVDNDGGQGRRQVEVDRDGEIYYTGIGREEPDYLPQCVTGADYLINLANLKKHSLAGVTLTAKNHFGSIYNDNYGRWTPSHLHRGINASTREMGSPNPLVSLMGHQDLGGKTLLYVIDALYGGMNQQTVAPNRWTMQPFNNDWTSSIFVSQDGVALDSVALDFLRTETEIKPYTENYLHEAAQAGNPSSEVGYDPEKDGENLQSLGVHEHWNNPEEKQYTGNQEQGEGIELVKVE